MTNCFQLILFYCNYYKLTFAQCVRLFLIFETDRPVTRRLVINEETIVERDVRTYGVVSLRPLSQVFALVQSWNHAQRLAIEYVDGTTVWYDCSDRGTLLATLLGKWIFNNVK